MDGILKLIYTNFKLQNLHTCDKFLSNLFSRGLLKTSMNLLGKHILSNFPNLSL